jgi:hypothetical protein
MKTITGYVEKVVTSYVGPACGFTSRAPVYEVVRAYRPFDHMMALFGSPPARPVWILRVTERNQDPVRYHHATRWEAEATARHQARGKVGRRDRT